MCSPKVMMHNMQEHNIHISHCSLLQATNKLLMPSSAAEGILSIRCILTCQFGYDRDWHLRKAAEDTWIHYTAAHLGFNLCCSLGDQIRGLLGHRMPRPIAFCLPCTHLLISNQHAPNSRART